MDRVVAQGTFDLLHPGHLHYLREAAEMGDQLHVIVARKENVTHKQPPLLENRQRLEMVGALDPVDEAHLGHRDDIFVPIRRISPDIIALGYDQHHDEDDLAEALAKRNIDCEVRRTSKYEPYYENAILSTGKIIDRILAQRQPKS